MAIDLGTANTLVYVSGRGIVVSEPSVVASDVQTGEVHAVGFEAERMIGRTPASIAATRPLRHGVIADFEVTEQMLRYFIRKVLDRRMAHPRLIVCAPSGVTEVEKRAVEEASLAAGARRVHLIEEPVAAAIGAGLEIDAPVGRMIVDIGGGTSEMAVISLGAIVVSRSLRVGGYEMDEAIAAYLRSERHLAIGSQTAERIKIAIGSAIPLDPEDSIEVRGRHLLTGLPTEIQLSSAEVRGAIKSPLKEILQAVRETLEETPPELASDIARDGILLAGGGTLIRGFDGLVAKRNRDAGVLCRVPAHVHRLRLRPGARTSRQAGSTPSASTSELQRGRAHALSVGSYAMEAHDGPEERFAPILPGDGPSDSSDISRTDELLALQKGPDEWVHRDELLFQTVHQSSEIWLKHAWMEVEEATRLVEARQIAGALRLLGRASSAVKYVEGFLEHLEQMSPWEYHEVRRVLGHGSGFDSPGFRGIRKVSPGLYAAFDSLRRRAWVSAA